MIDRFSFYEQFNSPKISFVARYIKVGVVNTLTTFLIYNLFIISLNIEAANAYLLAALLATLMNIILHGKITVQENTKASKFVYVLVAYFFSNLTCFLTIHFVVSLTGYKNAAFFLGVISYQILYMPSLYFINYKGNAK